MICDGEYTWTEDEHEKGDDGKPIVGDDGYYKVKSTKTYKEPCKGPVKPNIVFFGDKLPKGFHDGWDLIRNTEHLWTKEGD